jgi:hypothetical protein
MCVPAAAAILVAAVFLSAGLGWPDVAWAQVQRPASPSVLFFSGTDLWRQGQFVHGGALLSPAGLDADGFTLKLMMGGGGYSYYSGALTQDVDGRVTSFSALPGWRFRRNSFIVTVFAGPEMQDHRLTPDDTGGRLHGFYAGMRVGGEVWIQPEPRLMVAANASFSTIGPTTSLRAATGWRVFDAVYVGPETQMFWCADYQQLRVGAHVTGLHTGRLEWLAASGWARDSDGHQGLYLRLGVIARY